MTSEVLRRTDHFTRLPAGRLQRLEGWGMVSHSMGYVYRPSTIEGVRATLGLARETGRTLIPRGSGYSYGDTALNRENIVMELTRLNRVLDWDPETGIIRVEPGVTVRDLIRYALEDGWWPPVVPGALFPTMGGCASANVHGKNNWHMGSFIDHVISAELLLPGGEVVEIGPDQEPELFHAAIGGLGLLGVFLSLTLQLERVSSGLLNVREVATSTLEGMFEVFEQNLDAAYLVGWIDAFGSGPELGRGLTQIVHHVEDDPAPHRTLRRECQELPDTIMGVIPRSALWMAMKPLVNDPGMRLLNTALYTAGRLRSPRTAIVPHVQHHFFHDFVPNWKRSFQPIGIVQYQVFVPTATSREVFSGLLEGSQAAGLIPYLSVFKRHRRDDALLSYSVDGYSLSLDYRATPENLGAIQALCNRFIHEIVLPAGGRFYAAKDSVLDADAAIQSFGREAVDRFLAIKRRVDPEAILQSDLYRRLLATDR